MGIEAASAKTSRKRDHPVKYPMPDPIPDSVENALSTMFAGPPKKHWRYVEDRESARRSGRSLSTGGENCYSEWFMRRHLIPRREAKNLFDALTLSTEMEKAYQNRRIGSLTRLWKWYYGKFVNGRLHFGNPQYAWGHKQGSKFVAWSKRNPAEFLLLRKSYSVLGFFALIYTIYDLVLG